MTTVEKDITESSEKIDKVKRIIKDRALALEYKKQIPQTPLSKGTPWKELQFSKPDKTVRIGTVFSGIGAIEHAFQRLGLKHLIMFCWRHRVQM
jgi:DNA (cytosine-5)-methyltransferase 1